MSSAIPIFDTLKSQIATVLTADYRPIENPFIPEDNATALWNKGFGLAFGFGQNPEYLNKTTSSFIRQFSLVLINKINFTQTNVSKVDEQQKNLILDMENLQKYFDDDPTAGGVCTKSALLTDSGVGFVNGEKNKFLICEGVLEVTYFE